VECGKELPVIVVPKVGEQGGTIRAGRVILKVEDVGTERS